jgi:diaminohydroxyphosphoribosylaminopyrimidine deaminase/5-amino-6-(5-phosphoribosylamino)uracil reductase
LIAPFILRTKIGRPYVTLKWAQTADGKVAGPAGKRMPISGRASSSLVHLLRSRSDAMLVGVNTIINDDPHLTVRGVEWEEPSRMPPMAIILDTRLRVPHDATVIRENQIDVAVVCSQRAKDRIVLDDARELGVREVSVLTADTDPSGRRLDLGSALSVIADEFRHLTHILVEPGPTLAKSFFESLLVDRVWVFHSPKVVNDVTAPSSVAVPADYLKTGELTVGEDLLQEYLSPHTAAFFAGVPSADFVLAREAATAGEL